MNWGYVYALSMTCVGTAIALGYAVSGLWSFLAFFAPTAAIGLCLLWRDVSRGRAI